MARYKFFGFLEFEIKLGKQEFIFLRLSIIVIVLCYIIEEIFIFIIIFWWVGLLQQTKTPNWLDWNTAVPYSSTFISHALTCWALFEEMLQPPRQGVLATMKLNAKNFTPIKAKFLLVVQFYLFFKCNIFLTINLPRGCLVSSPNSRVDHATTVHVIIFTTSNLW